MTPEVQTEFETAMEEIQVFLPVVPIRVEEDGEDESSCACGAHELETPEVCEACS